MQRRLTDENLPDYLRELGLLPPGADAEVTPAGDGNINWVRRVRERGTGRSFVVKQARPALERFPQYQAPPERILCEASWLEIARGLVPEPVCPEVLRFDRVERVLVLEDLGRAERLDAALARDVDVTACFASLGRCLGAVHAGTGDPALAARFANGAMQRLHGDHVFRLPLRPNDFPLSAPLRRRAEELWRDEGVVRIADAAYARYLEPRGALVHGDVQAGNVLLAASGPKLLDAEIAHVGDPAFDLGTLVAHALLAALAGGRGASALPRVEAAWDSYRESGPGAVSFAAVARYAGLEMLRRTIGAARVAAVAEDEAGLAVLDAALRLVRTPPGGPAALVVAA
jgi:5-methylthioribose kinase